MSQHTVKIKISSRGFTVLEMTIALFLAGLILTISYWGFDASKILDHVNKKGVVKHVETVKYSAKAFFEHLGCLPVLKGHRSRAPDDYGKTSSPVYDGNKLEIMYKYPACAETTCKLYCKISESKLKNEWSGPYIKGVALVASIPSAGEVAFSLKELIGDNFYGKYLIGYREDSGKKYNELYYYIHYLNPRQPRVTAPSVAPMLDEKFREIIPEVCGTNVSVTEIPLKRYYDYFVGYSVEAEIDGSTQDVFIDAPRLARQSGKIFGSTFTEKCALVANTSAHNSSTKIVGLFIKILSRRLQ